MKKITAAILALAMLVSLGVPALAARDTSFFTPSEHTDLNFSDLRYEPVDVEAALSLFDSIRAKAENAENTEEVEKLFGEAIKASIKARDMATLTYILMCKDPASEAAGEYTEAYTKSIRIVNALYVLISDIIDSPCAEALKTFFTDDELLYFTDYEGLDEEEIELSEEINEKTNEFWAAENEAQSGEELYLKRAEIYIDTVRLNREAAALGGWDSYADYAYAYIFGRDFTPADAEEFAAMVKEYIVPVYKALGEKFLTSGAFDFYYDDYSGSRALETIAPYIELMSDEIAESLDFMRSHGFYDNDIDAKKSKQGFTTQFFGLNAPFFFNAADGSFEDLLTTVHELGHFNNSYWVSDLRGITGKSVDICEVHSQALELLFSEHYPSILDSVEKGRNAMEYIVFTKLGNIIDGALVDELERWCYAQEALTPEAISAKAQEILTSYGFEADPRFWVNISHIFETPFYYISYAVSAAGAFSFWLDAQSDYYRGVDDYLRFTAKPNKMGFNESFSAVGVDSPMSEEYLMRLADAVSYEMRMRGWYYDDVNISDWYFYAVDALCASTEGEEMGLFAPYELITEEYAGRFLDDAEDLSRVGIVCALYKMYGEGEIANDSPFTDLSLLSPIEKRAVDWAYKYGITKGTSPKTFQPDAACNNAMLVTMIYRAMVSADAEK
ncbi:MAG: S-layer homology domain-containing protein, partial [Oscillospiraceae bacterium]|nr:S-layer homology domain-containing protein [Oscillospiraceae bacterium]